MIIFHIFTVISGDTTVSGETTTAPSTQPGNSTPSSAELALRAALTALLSELLQRQRSTTPNPTTASTPDPNADLVRQIQQILNQLNQLTRTSTPSPSTGNTTPAPIDPNSICVQEMQIRQLRYYLGVLTTRRPNSRSILRLRFRLALAERRMQQLRQQIRNPPNCNLPPFPTPSNGQSPRPQPLGPSQTRPSFGQNPPNRPPFMPNPRAPPFSVPQNSGGASIRNHPSGMDITINGNGLREILTNSDEELIELARQNQNN